MACHDESESVYSQGGIWTLFLFKSKTLFLFWTKILFLFRFKIWLLTNICVHMYIYIHYCHCLVNSETLVWTLYASIIILSILVLLKCSSCTLHFPIVPGGFRAAILSRPLDHPLKGVTFYLQAAASAADLSGYIYMPWASRALLFYRFPPPVERHTNAILTLTIYIYIYIYGICLCIPISP